MNDSTITIDRSRALALLQEVADEAPDKVYSAGDNGKNNTSAPACLYWHPVEDEPGCIVGTALHRAGASKAAIQSLDATKGGTSIGSIRSALEDIGVHLTQEAVAIFHAAQAVQDGRLTWGQALAKAKVVAEARRVERGESR